MDEETAKFIINLFWLAHGGDCGHCTSEMVKPFIKKFPQFEYLANEIYKEKGHDPIAWKED